MDGNQSKGPWDFDYTQSPLHAGNNFEAEISKKKRVQPTRPKVALGVCRSCLKMLMKRKYQRGKKFEILAS